MIDFDIGSECLGQTRENSSAGCCHVNRPEVASFVIWAYLNQILEQDHRFIKRITAPMMGFKAFHSATATIAGIKAAHMIRKGQIAANGASAFQIFAGLAA